MTFVSLVEEPPAGLALLSYHRMGAASGTSETDASGNAHTGTYSNTGVTLGAAGALTGDADTAATFDGTDGIMTVPLNLSAQNKITVAFFMKYNGGSWPTISTTRTLISYGGWGVTGGWIINASTYETGLEFIMAASTVGAGVFLTPPSLGAYHMVVVTFDRTAATLAAQYSVMIDGVAKTPTPIAGHTTVRSGNFANLTSMYVGYGGPATPYGHAPITVDELAVFSGLMTPTQAAQLFGSSTRLLTATYAQATRQPWRLPVTGTMTTVAIEGTLTYVWTPTLPAGSAASLTGQGTATASIIPDVEGVYGLSCTATDTGGNAATLSGSTQIVAPIRVKQSAAWLPANAKIWNGSAWV